MRITAVCEPIDNELRVIAERLPGAARLGSIEEIGRLLAGLPSGGGPSTLDLVGHATRENLLRIGTSVMDPREQAVAAALGELRRGGVLTRTGIGAVRILGCSSARAQGADAVIGVADLLGVRVFGATTRIFARHYDEGGFASGSEVLLISDLLLRVGRSGRLPASHSIAS